MFRRDVKLIHDLVLRNLRSQGLETPLLQKRLIDSWALVAGSLAAQYTKQIYIRNQILFVNISNPALRGDMSMRKRELVSQLNTLVGAQIIVDIRL